MPDEHGPRPPVAPAPPSLPVSAGSQPAAGPGWKVRERPVPERAAWDAPPVPPSAAASPSPPPPPAPAATSPLLADTPPGRPPQSRGARPIPEPGAAPRATSGFPTILQLLAALVVAAVVVAGVGVYFLRSQGAATTATAPPPPGGAVAVIRSGPAELTSQSLSGGGSGRSLKLPGSPNAVVTTPDGSRAFLLDTSRGQVIPVDLLHGSVGAPILAGKLPTDEEMSRDGATLYVTDNLGGAVIPIDTASGTPGPAQQLAQGVISYVPSPSGSTAVVSVANGAGQPGIIGFYSPTAGLGSAALVGSNSPTELFYSPDGSTIWVTEDGVGNLPGVVIPVDVRSHAVGRAIAVGHGVAGSAMSSDGRLLLVTDSLDRSVSVVDLVARAVVATVPVGAGPVRAELSPGGSTAWVACTLDRTLVPIDLHSDRAGKPIPLANAPADLTIPRGASAAWVLLPSSAGNVAFLNGTRVGRSTQVGNSPGLLIAPDSRSAWVANSLSDTVQRVDMAGGTSGTPIRVSRLPNDLALTRDGRTLLVLSFGDGTHAGFLTAIDTSSSRASAPLDVGVAPSSLTLAPGGTTAYVVNRQANSITAVDLTGWRVSARIAVPCSPTQLVATRDGAGLYIDCSASSEVLPMTAPGHAIGAPIAVGSSSELVMGNQGKTIFVKADHVLQEIDVATDKVVLSRAETANIVSITPTSDDATLVAVENTGGVVLLLKTATLATTTSVSVGSRPDSVELSSDGARAYVLDTSQQKLYVVDVLAAKLAATIDVAPGATAVTVPSRQP